MFRFANPIFLYLLALIPLFVVAYVFMRRKMKKNLCRFGDPELMSFLMPDVSPVRRHVKFSLLMLALALIIFMLARPQFGTRNEEYKRSGIEAIVAVDVSNSMLCEDVAPNRLQKAKMIVSKLVDQLDEDRMGLIAFAGDAITLLPLTQDGVSAKMFLEQLSPQTVSVQGTNMSEAIQKAMAGFSSSESKNVGRALIFITDAEDNEPGADEIAREASKMGVKIFVLSVGTAQGGPIPMGNGKYKTDLSGNTVMTHLNESAGQSLAKAGNGVYMHVDQTDVAQAMLEAEISKMQKEDFVSSMYSEYDEQFVAVAILLLIVLIIEICVMEKKNPFFNRIKIRSLRANQGLMLLFALLFSLFTPTESVAQNAKENIRIGNYNYRDAQFQKAETYYSKSLDKDATLEAYFNLANSQLLQGRDSDAYATYMKAMEVPTANKLKRSQLFHNMGNVMYASGLAHMKIQDGNANQLFGTAVENYKSALRMNPDDNETRYNLALAQYMFKKTQNDPKQNNQNNQNKDNKDQNKDKNQDKKDQDKKDQDKKDQDKKDQNKDKNKDQDKKDQDNKDQNKDQDKQNPDKDKQDKQQPQPQKGQMDEKTTEQLLNSAQQDEKKVQRKLIRQKAQHRSLEKDW